MGTDRQGHQRLPALSRGLLPVSVLSTEERCPAEELNDFRRCKAGAAQAAESAPACCGTKVVEGILLFCLTLLSKLLYQMN